jgi:vacuolar-type H+-ATPase subunit H
MVEGPHMEAPKEARHIIEEARKTAEAESPETAAKAEQEGRIIIEAAKKRGDSELIVGKRPDDVEQISLQIGEEIEVIMAAPCFEAHHQIMRKVAEKAIPEAKDKTQPAETTY